MSVRTDVVNLNVNVNGNKAQNELNQLRKKAADVKFEMDGLRKGTQAYIEKKKELATITDEMARLKKQIGLTALSGKELIRELNQMKALKSSMQPFTQEWKNLDKEIKKVENRLYDVKNGVQGFSSFFSKIKDEVKQFGMVAAGYLGFQFLSSQFSNIIRGAGKMSDTLADIRRVAGLTDEEVNNLNNSLKEIDTRTSVQGLREITVIAGKLGVAKADLLGFTQAVDEMVVTLGDELGNADQITSQLGKILNVFDGKITGDNIKLLANAYIELANTGSSTGGFIADFDQRLSGIAKTSNFTLGKLSGLGAGLEELGGRVESSATAVQKLLISIASDLPAAAKIAGKPIDEFNKLFGSDPAEALLQYAEGLTKNKTSFAAITASFADAGEEGARVIETLSKLGQSSDFLRGRIDLGDKAIQRTTASTQAFALKNETFGATLDKLGKEFNRLVASPGVTNFLQGAVNGALKFIQVLRGIPNFIAENKVALLTLVAGLILLNKQYIISAATVIKDTVAKIANTVITRGAAIATNIAIAAQAAYITITNLLIGRITAATAATRLFNLAIKSNPIGLLVTLVGGAILAYNAFKKKATDVADALSKLSMEQRLLSEVQKTAQESIRGTLATIEEQRRVLEGTTASLEAKKIALQKLISINPDFVNTLKLSRDGHLEGAAAIDIYIKKLNEKALAEAISGKKTQLFGKIIEQQQVIDSNQLNEKQEQGIAESLTVKRTPSGAYVTGKKAPIEDVRKKNAQLTAKNIISSIELEINALDNLQKKYIEVSKVQFRPTVTENTPTNPGGKDDGESNLDKLKSEAEEFQKELLRLRRELEIAGMSADDAEIARIKDKYQELLQKAMKYNVDLMQVYGFQSTELQRIYDKIRARELAAFKKYNEDRAKEQDDALAKEKKKLEDARKKRQELSDQEAERKVKDTDEKKKKAQEEKDEKFQQLKDDIDMAVAYASAIKNVFESISNYQKSLEDKALAREKKANDDKKNNFKRLLDNKLLSEAQYNLKVAQLDEEFAEKEREIRRKQAKREKALNIFESLINTASAVAAALPNIPLSIAVGIAGAIQTAFIAATPLPELGKGDWIRSGDKHSAPSGGINAKIEKDEAVMSAAAMNSNKIFSVTGNTAQITSALNGRAGGANWAGGAQVVEMATWRAARPVSINPQLPSVLEQGGIVKRIDGMPTNSSGAMEELLQQLIKEQQLNTAEIKTMKTKLHAIVSIKEFREEEALYEASKRASGLG